MTRSTDRQIWTDEEFMALSDDGGHYELVDGELIDRVTLAWSMAILVPISAVF